jgi:hypothetical protein
MRLVKYAGCFVGLVISIWPHLSCIKKKCEGISIDIDNSRYSSFWANPELYRLTFEVNIVPKITPFYFGRGIHLHELNEARNKATMALENLSNDPQKISERSKQMGQALFEAFKRRWDGDLSFQLLHDGGSHLAEIEFRHQIPGSPHSIVGKMDEILMYKGEPWVGDVKTANKNTTEAKKRIEFGYASQPLFYINAARMLGYPVKGMVYRVVTEHTPPKHFVIESKRTEYQLQQHLRSVHQTAETILMYRKTFGIDKPWPHGFPYPCNSTSFDGSPACEYSSICQRPTSELTEDDLANFTRRIDHLKTLREAE